MAKIQQKASNKSFLFFVYFGIYKVTELHKIVIEYTYAIMQNI